MSAQDDRIRAIIRDATLPYAMARAATPILKQTPENEQARREGRARRWVEAEALSVGYALAEVLAARLESLDPGAGDE